MFLIPTWGRAGSGTAVNGVTISNDQTAALTRLADEINDGRRAQYEYLRRVFGVLGNKWAVLILLVLEADEMRHAAIRRSLDQVMSYERISQRILTFRLRAFEETEILIRTVSDDIPPKVSYRLTEKGQALAGQVRQIIDIFG